MHKIERWASAYNSKTRRSVLLKWHHPFGVFKPRWVYAETRLHLLPRLFAPVTYPFGDASFRAIELGLVSNHDTEDYLYDDPNVLDGYGIMETFRRYP